MSTPIASSSEPSPSSGSAPHKGGYMRREDLIGKSVISRNAEIIGSVKDLAVSIDGKVAIQVERKPSSYSSSSSPSSSSSATASNSEEDLFIGPDEIQAVGDVVLLKTSSEAAGTGISSDNHTGNTVQPSPGPSASSSASPTKSVAAQTGSSAFSSSPSSSGSQIPPPPFPGSSISQGKTCPRCSYLNSINSRFCIKCGEKLQ